MKRLFKSVALVLIFAALLFWAAVQGAHAGGYGSQQFAAPVQGYAVAPVQQFAQPVQMYAVQPVQQVVQPVQQFQGYSQPFSGGCSQGFRSGFRQNFNSGPQFVAVPVQSGRSFFKQKTVQSTGGGGGFFRRR